MNHPGVQLVATNEEDTLLITLEDGAVTFDTTNGEAAFPLPHVRSALAFLADLEAD